MNKTGKVWGSTELIVQRPDFEVHRIVIIPNGFCSVHRHVDKVNMFAVESGELSIEVWKSEYDLRDWTELGVGDQTEVPAGELHRFSNLGEEVVAYEFYWPTRWARLEKDIERLIPGGCSPKPPVPSAKQLESMDT